MALKTILLLAIVASSFSGAFSVCAPPNLELASVLETHTTAFTPAATVPAGDPITGTGGIMSMNNGDLYFTAAANAATRVVTISPIVATFKDLLDMRLNDGDFNGQYYVTCTAAGGNPQNYTADFTITINDTNNRPPVFNIQNDYYQLNLDTWISSQPINFIEGDLEVYDMDFWIQNAHVEVTAHSDDPVYVQSQGVQYGPNPSWNTTFNLFLKADADYGNYTVHLTASDGLHTANKNVTLYVGAGAQFQATAALTALLVSVATWLNMK